MWNSCLVFQHMVSLMWSSIWNSIIRCVALIFQFWKCAIENCIWLSLCDQMWNYHENMNWCIPSQCGPNMFEIYHSFSANTSFFLFSQYIFLLFQSINLSSFPPINLSSFSANSSLFLLQLNQIGIILHYSTKITSPKWKSDCNQYCNIAILMNDGICEIRNRWNQMGRMPKNGNPLRWK